MEEGEGLAQSKREKTPTEGERLSLSSRGSLFLRFVDLYFYHTLTQSHIYLSISQTLFIPIFVFTK